VSRIKGNDRPVQKNESRSTILASLQFVDYVVFFNEETPLELIQYLIPDVLTKGADYSVETIVGATIVLEHGGEVKTIELTEGHSTTKIITNLLHN
jgi:rfaE bifunctional protein nucleotidyltransferase chain/domain